MTSVMGLAWASTASGAPPSNHAPSFDHIGLPSVDADEDAVRLSSPLPGPWQQMHDAPSAEAQVAPAPAPDDPTPPAGPQDQAAPTRAGASEVTATPEARPPEDRRSTAEAEDGRRKAAGAGKQKGERTAAERAATRGAAADGEPVGKRAVPPAKAAQDDRRAGAVRATQQGRGVSAAPDPDVWRTNVMATHEEVEFVQMSDQTVLVGFHEAAMPGAKPLAAAATPDANHGRGKVPFSAVDDPLNTVILPTRARTTGAASAMDVVIPARETVFAPVTGTVTEVDNYKLYGTHPDNRLVIVPDARPDLRVVILHVEGVKVSPGDEVTAGQTPIAVGANPFTFESQIDRFARPLMARKGEATPHVHIELR